MQCIVNSVVSYTALPLQVNGMCPLLIASNRNDLPIARMCIQSPLADLDIANHDGKTALILAAEKGHTDMVRALLHEDVLERQRISIEHRDVSFLERPSQSDHNLAYKI